MRLAAVFLLCFALGFIRGQLPAAGSENLIISGDTDSSGMAASYELINDQVRVWENQQMIWESPAEWKVTQLLLADADNDGVEELLMVLWKYGSFGDVRPFWHEREDKSYSCHLFMYRLQAGRMKAVWCSSAVRFPIESIQEATGPDQKLSLLVREKAKLPFLYAQSVWQWQDWGFARV